MLKNRLIPCVLMKNGQCVQSKKFSRYQALGNPFTIVQRLSDWASDELIYLDISKESSYDLKRNDTNFSNFSRIQDIISEISKQAFMPLTFGGGIRNVSQIFDILNRGADKICINTAAFHQNGLIEDAVKEFGSQCIVVSIDCKLNQQGGYEVFTHGGKVATGISPEEWGHIAEDKGCGEIFLNSIDRDGTGLGYDTELIKKVCQRVSTPVIACGGVGTWDDFENGIHAGASAVSAANIFHYSENSVYHAKLHLYEKKLNFRKPVMGINENTKVTTI